jgi:aspartyl aminopeptidase
MPSQNAKQLCDFIDASPTAWHAVDAAAASLSARGAVRLDEREAWHLSPGASYYVIRDGAAIAAFRVGTKPPSEAGLALAGAHADAPGFRARMDKSVAARGMERVAVEAYGGPIYSTWLDRPLSLAGRVVVEAPDGRLESRLVNFARPMAVIPNLAIHFNREMNKGVEYPVNAALLPIVGASGPAGTAGTASWIIRAVARELSLEPSAIHAADLAFVDAAPSIVFGVDAELVSAPRIDNLEGCHAILTAFQSATAADHGQLVVLFDNEETGSQSPRGADSSFLRDIVERLVALTDGSGPEAVYRCLAMSFCVSVDGAQGWHPSYADKFDEEYAPVLNGGPAVKANANVRYATEAVGEASFRRFCEIAGVPFQRFRMRADLPAGTTIGPISASLMGVRTVDVGVPMLAMHSARETAGAYDHDSMTSMLKAFFSVGPGDIVRKHFQ